MGIDNKKKEKHYDVAVLGVWFGANYGSVLNGYAVYKILKDMGLSVLMVHKINATPDDREIHGTHNAHFIEKFYPESAISPNYKFEELTKLNDICDTFLTGSDQIWHYNINSYFNMAFLLNFVHDDKRKVSFGTSFGHLKDFTPPDKLDESVRLLSRFNAISVREDSGIEICKNNYNVRAKTVIEPVFCVERKVFSDLSEQSDIVEEEPYILTYILDPDTEKRNLINYYSEYTGKRVINVLDGQPSTYKKNKEILNLTDMRTGIGAEDLLKLYEKADFVITDSFHGTAFSIIYNKSFISLANKKRGHARFEDLLRRFGLMDRLIYDLARFGRSPAFLDPIDYKIINEKVEQAKTEAITWLEDALKKPVNELTSINFPSSIVTHHLEKNKCVGCSACVNTCPKDALSLKPDDLGYYRAYADYYKCVDCGQCTKVCPALNLPKKSNSEAPECFAYQAKDEELLEKSSSGGVFSALAEAIFKKGGKVCGVSWTDDFRAEHIIISDKNELHRLQKSKYLQSYIGIVFREIKRLLDEGSHVLFSGCPCQVAGLKNYLKKSYRNLILVDLLCGNSPSAGFFKKYLNESFPKGLSEYTFRYKNKDNNWNPGWRGDVAKVSDLNGSDMVIRGSRDDNYQRVYHNHTMCAPHCEKCQYQEVPRFGDLTIGDFWGYERHADDIDVKKGVSVILCNNSKGKSFFESLKPSETGINKIVPFEWIAGNGYAKKGTHNYCSAVRDDFYEAVKQMPFSAAVDYVLKPNKGIYRDIYNDTTDLLQYDTRQFRFQYEREIWEELFIGGISYLMVKNPKEKPGHYATMAVNKKLQKGKTYILKIRFRIRTASTVLNIHVKDSGSRLYQLIYSFNLTDVLNGDKWIEKSITFIPDSELYDEFMIGAAQLSGTGNFITFDYINIKESEGEF